ncbi:hypothetical protein KNP414_01205 [Paenibacillus mucilaginosus KNP414]|uniref:Uncharacterized protein n=1 Tax=Paenibacillus mucilaginosus (strain KNP414) TaxID=1036673 RepID=F8FF72_PAEMK|nr:hypothetical protein KNP414_01205 [Paenibacillus mucilaginosus KNP414]
MLKPNENIRWEYICTYNGEHVYVLYLRGKFSSVAVTRRWYDIDQLNSAMNK